MIDVVIEGDDDGVRKVFVFKLELKRRSDGIVIGQGLKCQGDMRDHDREVRGDTDNTLSLVFFFHCSSSQRKRKRNRLQKTGC